MQPELVRGVSRAQVLTCIIPVRQAKIPGHTKGYYSPVSQQIQRTQLFRSSDDHKQLANNKDV